MDLEAVKRRYSETVSKTDALGRSIKVGRLRPAQQLKVAEFTNGDNAVKMVIRAVSMVRAIDMDDLGFPKSRAEVDSRIDRLDDEGLAAVMEAMTELYDSGDAAESKPIGDAAGNS